MVEVEVRVDDPSHLVGRVAGLAQSLVDQGMTRAADLEDRPHQPEVGDGIGSAARLVQAGVEHQHPVAGVDGEAHHGHVTHDPTGLAGDETADIRA